ncbi:MAG TPA: DUF494 family protein [Bacteroidetes bacterium]|nr:DUF494 family protein [Bacteroidota bacterium]
MNERVVEIIVFLMDQIKGNKNNKLEKLESLSQDLLSRGYSQSEISSAFSWIIDRIKNDFEELYKNTGPVSSQSFRVLHELEQMIIEPEAYGYLLQLRELNIIDEVDLEHVIERAMMLGTAHIGIDEIKAITTSLLIQNSNPFGDTFYIDDKPPTIH